MLSLRTLGELRLDGAGGEPLAGRRKELVLLAYLARRSPRPVRRAELIGLFWADRDEALARQSLRQALLRLRRVIGDGLIATAEIVQLAEGAVELDVTAFEADLAAGRPRDALERWGGEFLPEAEDVGGETYRMWLDAEREGLRRRLADGFEQLVDTDAGRAVAEAKAHLLPLDERVHRRWVETLRRDGHAAEALSRHAAFVARLRRELGVHPSAEFLRLGTELERVAASTKSATGSPGSIALFTPDLVGRDAALTELRAAWSAVARGEAAVVVVEGGEGMGKTLLCEEFLRELRSGSHAQLVLHARGRAEDPASPWQCARELLAGIANAPGLGGVPDRALAEMSRLVPAIRPRFPRLPDSTADDRVLPGALQHVLGIVAQEVPIAVFLDDVAYFDAASRELVLWLTDHCPPGVLLLLTARPEWLQSQGALAGLCRSSGVRRIKLTPLGETEVEALLRSMLELPADERPVLAARLHAETGGNPYHVSEIISTMVDEGRLVLDARGFWRTPPGIVAHPLPVPIGVRDAAVRRFAVLPEHAQLVLRAAAALPEPFEAALLRVTVPLTPAEYEAALDELIARRLLRPASSLAGTFEFVSPLMRRFARDRLAGTEAKTDRASRGRRTRRAALLVLATLPLIAAIAVVLSSQAASAPPVIAVGQLAAHGAPEIAAGAAATADMLATNLAQVPGLKVVSSARMHEVVAQLGGSAGSDAVWAGAARQAGATELIEGALHARAGGGVRLDLRRVDLRTGAVRAAYTVEGADPFDLVDRATARLAADLDLPSRSPRLAEVTTPSFVAYRFYEEGQRSYAVADYRGALRLFNAALAEDSLFGMAAHYAGLSHVRLSQRIPPALHERLLNVAARVTDRERLLMRGTWETATGGSHQVAVAETLAIRYPTEPDGHYLLAAARMSAGDFLGAMPHLERVIAMDSLGLRGTHARCLACDALARTISAYTHADSLAAAERVGRDWVRRQPGSALAWFNLALSLEATDRYEDALAARRKAASLHPIDRYDALFPAMLHIRAGDYAAADRLLRELARSTSPEIQREARWFLTISLRNQGRLREALETISAAAPGGADSFRQHQAQVLLELGRTGEAARLFDSIAVVAVDPRSPAVMARHRTWNLTHRSAALAAAGDTTGLNALTDTIEAYGSRSRYGRDWRLHHHVRGLLAAARMKPEEAAAQFRKAIYSPTSGYTRTNLELARVLLDLGRARDAVSALQPAFRGPLEASNLYVTRTELHELLGRAWQAAGQSDSAAVHYQRVLHAWRNADPEFQARRDGVRMRLRGLGRSESSARSVASNLSGSHFE